MKWVTESGPTIQGDRVTLVSIFTCEKLRMRQMQNNGPIWLNKVKLMLLSQRHFEWRKRKVLNVQWVLSRWVRSVQVSVKLFELFKLLTGRLEKISFQTPCFLGAFNVFVKRLFRISNGHFTRKKKREANRGRSKKDEVLELFYHRIIFVVCLCEREKGKEKRREWERAKQSLIQFKLIRK